MHIQATINSRYRFLTMSANYCFRTHYFLSFNISFISRYLRDGNMVEGFWIAGGVESQCETILLVPLNTLHILDDHHLSVWREAYNLFQ